MQPQAQFTVHASGSLSVSMLLTKPASAPAAPSMRVGGCRSRAADGIAYLIMQLLCCRRHVLCCSRCRLITILSMLTLLRWRQHSVQCWLGGAQQGPQCLCHPGLPCLHSMQAQVPQQVHQAGSGMPCRAHSKELQIHDE